MSYYNTDLREAVHIMVGDQYDDVLENLGKVFAEKIAPLAVKIDSEKEIPGTVYKLLAEQGFYGIYAPENHGGLGLPYPVYIAALEMLSKACGSTAISVAIHSTAASGIEMYGSDAQREAWLPGLFDGSKLAAFGLTEPNSGSDAKSMQTKAELKNDTWVLNGSKTYITNAGVADVYYIFARTDKGESAFLLPKETKGFSITKDIEKLGFKGSKTGQLVFENCELPKDAIVGKEGEGFSGAKTMLHGGRITIAALSVGIAQAALDKAVAYSKEREQFGKSISSFQMIRDKLAKMQTEVNAARLLTLKAAVLRGQGKDFLSQSSQAKLLASEMCVRVCDEAIQIHGGNGYADEYDVHRHWRDAKLMTIGEGTSEVQKLLISKELLK